MTDDDIVKNGGIKGPRINGEFRDAHDGVVREDPKPVVNRVVDAPWRAPKPPMPRDPSAWKPTVKAPERPSTPEFKVEGKSREELMNQMAAARAFRRTARGRDDGWSR